MHSQDPIVFHQDLKPLNVLVSKTVPKSRPANNDYFITDKC